MRIATEVVEIALGDRSYEIRVGCGLLGEAASYEGLATRGAHAVVVTNTVVGPRYAARLVEALSPCFANVRVIELPDGEVHKDQATLNRIFDELLRSACDRKSILFALGGGVVGDMTGFAAACYMRGIDYVQVPTTLLAQVDSSVGGKTGINHPLGKNMIGAFHQPRRVIADLDTLDTLPQRELIAGLAEIIKYGPVADAAFLDWIEAHVDALLARDKPALAHAVIRSCRIKAAVVGADEREAGLRAILNFGHTFGHAIETGLGYGNWLHGEAVGCGMVLAARLSARLGLIDAAYSVRLAAVIASAGLPVRPPALGVERYLELMHLDKKAEAGQMKFVLLDGAGKATMRAVSETMVAALLRDETAAA